MTSVLLHDRLAGSLFFLSGHFCALHNRLVLLPHYRIQKGALGFLPNTAKHRKILLKKRLPSKCSCNLHSSRKLCYAIKLEEKPARNTS